MREMMVRFEILDQDLNLKKHRNPIHHLESRIKKPASIFEKLERYGKEPTLENLERYIMDVAGVRVICSYIHDVYRNSFPSRCSCAPSPWTSGPAWNTI